MYKIYGTKYQVEVNSDQAVDSYAFGGELVEEEPEKGKLVGYVAMEDNSVVACFKKTSKALPITLLAILVIGLIGAGVYFYITSRPSPAIGGTMLETAVNKNVIVFNGIMSVNAGNADIRFVNGDFPATVSISGDGVKSTEIQVTPNETLLDIPVEVTSKENAVEVKIKVTSEGDTAEFSAIVEVPDNNNQESPDGLNGYFSKELILDEN